MKKIKQKDEKTLRQKWGGRTIQTNLFFSLIFLSSFILCCSVVLFIYLLPPPCRWPFSDKTTQTMSDKLLPANWAEKWAERKGAKMKEGQRDMCRKTSSNAIPSIVSICRLLVVVSGSRAGDQIALLNYYTALPFILAGKIYMGHGHGR